VPLGTGDKGGSTSLPIQGPALLVSGMLLAGV
jgi:hypothetical protein